MTSIECHAACRRGWVYAMVFPLAMLLAPVGVNAQSVSIESGAIWQTDDAVVDFDCATLDVAGTLAAQDADIAGIGQLAISGVVSAEAATIDVGGDWNNQGNFVAGSSVVRLVDRCDATAASISGSTDFSTLLIESARGKAYQFAAGLTQTVATTLRLAGASGVLMPVGSTQPGTQASLGLNLSGNQDIAWIQASDMVAPEGYAWIARGAPEVFNSVDAGNNFRWFGAAPVEIPMPIPVNSSWALLALLLALVGAARRRIRWR